MRRAGRIALWIAVILTMPVLLMAAALVGFVYMAGPQTWTAALDTAMAQAASSDMQIRTGTLRRDARGILRLDTLEIADADGTWLTAEELVVDMNPLSLVQGLADFQTIRASRVTVLRPPVSSKGVQAAEPLSLPDQIELPQLPVAVRLGALSVDQLILLEGMTPTTTRLQVTGDARLSAADLGLNLDVRPMDFGESFLSAQARVDAATGDLTVDIRGDLPVVKPLDTALDVSADSRLRINVTGGGPLHRAVLELDASVDGLAEVLGDLTLSIVAGKTPTMTAEFAVFANLLGGVAAEPAKLIGDTIELRGRLTMPEAERIEIDKFAFLSPYLTVSAQGRAVADLSTLALQGRARLDFHEGIAALIDGAQFEQANLRFSMSGPLENLNVSADASLVKPVYEAYQAADMVVDLQARTDLATTRGQARAVLRAPELGRSDMNTLLGSEVVLQTDLHVDQDLLELKGLSLTAFAAKLGGAVTLGLADMAATGDLQLDVEDLTRVPQLADLVAGGSAGTRIGFQGLTPEGGDVSITAKTTGLNWQDPTLAELAGSGQTIKGTVALSQGISADVALTSSGPLSAAAQLVSKDDTLSGKYALTLVRLPAGLMAPGMGEVRDIGLRGVVSGTLSAPEIKGTLTADTVEIEGIAISEPRLQLDARDLADDPRLMLNGSAMMLDAPLRFRSQMTARLSENLLKVDQTRLDFRTVQLEAALDLDMISSLATGQVLVASNDLSIFSDLAGVSLAGDLATQINLVDAGGRMDAAVLLEGRSIAADTAEVTRLFGNLALTDLLADEPGLSGQFEAIGIAADGVQVPRALVRLGGGLLRPELTLQAKTAEPVASEWISAARIDLTQAQGLAVSVNELSLTTEDGGISLLSPLNIGLEGEQVSIDGLALTTSFGGRIQGRGAYSSTRIAAELALVDLPIGPLAEMAGESGFSGVAEGNIQIDTAAAADRAKAVLRLKDIVVPDVPTETPFALNMDAQWRGDLAETTVMLRGPFAQPLRADFRAALPWQPDVPLSAPPPDGQLSGQLIWQGELSNLLALLPETDHLLAGAAGIDVLVDGTWSQPRMRGQIELTDGAYENLQAGTILRNMAMKLSFDDQGTGQFTMQAADPEGGTVSGEGRMGGLGAKPSATIAIDLRNLLAVRRDEARALVSGTTDLTWDGEQVTVKSRHTLDRVDIFLAAPDLPPSVVAIELERDKPEKPVEPQKTNETPLPINLDIEVTSPGQFFVRGRGLESEWRGTLAVGGMADDPQVRSTFSAVRGSLSLLGRDFRLDVGELGVAEDLSPSFRIELVRETPDLTGRITIAGDPAKPDLSFTSTPDLPQDEVLPRLLFDKTKQSLSPLEAINLAQGIRTLTNGKPGTTDQIRDAVGLDVLRFEEGSSEDSAGAVSVGRYVREGVYVGAKKSIDSDAGSVVVEIDVLPNVKVDAEVIQDGNSSTGITWERKY